MFYFVKFRLRSALIGQSASVYKHWTKRRLRRRRWLSKVDFQCEKCSLSKKKFQNFSFEVNFEINFQCERGLKLKNIQKYSVNKRVKLWYILDKWELSVLIVEARHWVTMLIGVLQCFNIFTSTLVHLLKSEQNKWIQQLIVFYPWQIVSNTLHWSD